MRKDHFAVYDISHTVSVNERWYKEYFAKDCVLSPAKALEALQQNVEETPNVLQQVDSDGMTLLHWAALLATASEKNQVMCQWLLETVDVQHLNRRVRRASNTIGPYDGETVVHILLVQKDTETLARLLQRPGIDLGVRAYGRFFRAASGWGTYYGEYPISFAVSAGYMEGLDLLVGYAQEHGYDLEELLRREDSFGNTALHMAVLHQQEDMYKWVHRQLTKTGPLQPHLNGLGLTSLSLAAQCNHRGMFDIILRELQEIKWVYGPATCVRLPMEQIDSIGLTLGARRHEKEYRSVMELVLEQHCGKIAAHPLIADLQNKKWKRFGRYAFGLKVALRVLKLYQITAVAGLHVDMQEMSLNGVSDEQLSDKRDHLYFNESLLILCSTFTWVGFWMDVVASIAASRKKAQALKTERDELHPPSEWILDEDWRGMLREIRLMTGHKAVEKVLVPVAAFDIIHWLGEAALTTHIFLFFINEGGVNEASAVALSLGSCFTWTAAAVLLVPWEYFGVLVIIIIEVFKMDVSTFFCLLSFNIISTSQALDVLSPLLGKDIMPGVGGFHGLLTMWRVLLGEKPAWVVNASVAESADMRRVGYLPVFYYVLFTLTSAIVLLRLLISMFNKTFAQVWSGAQERWRLEFGMMIMRFERRLSFLLPRSVLERFCAIDDESEPGHSYVFVVGGWGVTKDTPLKPAPPSGDAGLRLEVSRLLAENERLKTLLREAYAAPQFLS
mmetsp:Transcript_8654/g.15566  ORF Transcript_8654/g.15566 Transcript_8654/m.15566 type:complete len:729 (-) Transcript_8654:5-2191(-)